MARKMDSRASEASIFDLFDEGDYVINCKDGSEVKLRDLQGKIIGFVFSTSASQPCNTFIERLTKAYNEIKMKTSDFEIIFITDDEKVGDFNKSIEKMPWLMVPFSHRITQYNIIEHYNIERIPAFVVIGSDGRKVLSINGRSLIARFDANAYPFTEEHIRNLTKAQDELATKLPRELNYADHEHILRLVNDPYNLGMYGCDICRREGSGWAYHCEMCGYDLHPACVGFDLTVAGVVSGQTPSEAGQLGQTDSQLGQPGELQRQGELGHRDEVQAQAGQQDELGQTEGQLGQTHGFLKPIPEIPDEEVFSTSVTYVYKQACVFIGIIVFIILILVWLQLLFVKG